MIKVTIEFDKIYVVDYDSAHTAPIHEALNQFSHLIELSEKSVGGRWANDPGSQAEALNQFIIRLKDNDEYADLGALIEPLTQRIAQILQQHGTGAKPFQMSATEWQITWVNG